MKLQLSRRLNIAFYIERIRSCCYLINNELILHFMYSYVKFLGVTYRHKLKHSLLGVPRKMVLLKFENVNRD